MRTHLYKDRPRNRMTGLWVTLALFCVLALAFLLVAGGASDVSQEQQRAIIRDAVTRAAVACYAIEGRYPPSASYLKEHYGVVWNEDRYIVTCDTFAQNVMPEIRVLAVGVAQ